MSFSSVRSSSLITSVIILILFVCLLSLTSFSPRASLAAPQIEQPTFKKAKRSRAFVPGNVIVRYRDESTARIQQRQATQLRADNGEQLEIRVESLADASLVPGLRLAKVDPDRTLQAIVALKSHPDVIYAEPDYILQRDALPNDPSFGQLYGMTNIHAQQAWDTTTGSSSVVVGVIDEGIDINHQDLQANIWTNSGEIAGNGIDDDGNGFIDDVQGWNFIPCNLGDPVGCGSNQVYAGSGADAHGTHVAGTIGAVGNNGIGVVGVNWQVKIMPLKFLGPTDGTTSDAIRAYGYAKMMRDLWVNTGGTKGANLRVLNNSYGGDGFSQSQSDAINSLNSSGILFVAAAGNDGVNTDVSPHYPSSYDLPNLISVAATDSSDQISSFSNFGTSTVHMGAPGSNILSTTPNNTYSFFSGTSMATPHVAGAAALLLARFPNLTVQQLRGLLMFNGDDLASLATKTLTGRRLNVLNSLQSGAENDTTPPGTVTNLALTSQQGRTLSLQWTALGDDGASGRASLYDVSFVDSANPGAPIPLAKLKPNVSGTLQTVTVKIPFRHTSGNVRLREFDNVGNEGTPALLPVSISADISDPYVVSETAPPGTLSTGTPIGLNADDKYSENYPLPFSFPFYGQVYTSVTISTNGALYFSTPPKRGNGDADDVPSAVSGLNSQKMIAALWDDLRTDRRAGDDVYVTTPDLNRIIFRWQGVTFGNGTAATEFPVNFEVELRRDGSVITRYGSGNTNIFPVVGISGGEPDAYSVNSHTSETSPTVLTNAQTVNFALRTAPAPSNPIDDGRVFVRQQYLDFLGREPDQAGWDYWTGQIANCGTNQQCIHDQRIGVSAAYFFSDEFQKTGYFVYLLYKSSLTRQPNYTEFSADRPQVVAGGNLEAAKQAFAESFVQRTAFTNLYPVTQTRDAFVDALIQSARQSSNVDLTTHRAELLSTYDAGTSLVNKRAVTLRKLIDYTEYAQAEFNPAFVLMQYFGYLRRDVDSGGYNFWLGVLNNLPPPNNFRNMVCAFITSDEYQQRFSTIISRHNSDCSSN